ncbi:uncharacterized protein Triagg1_8745 [Trichoderma aggressivum f. europaeum]|uniref:C2H2-type domain-containing protein n=1 Tax=Trichoderma aggressivum f. europaeum TaxID=173218 RepID=A0AAE1I7K9_9HYPO|nr:hypothetical protein Triagg1_8745 [Trichoderma aggressivum f. europaeum]
MVATRSMRQKQENTGDFVEGRPSAAPEPLGPSRQHVTNSAQHVDTDSDSDPSSDGESDYSDSDGDRGSGYPDDESDSSDSDCDDEDDAPNLFECATITTNGDVMALQDSARVRTDTVLPATEEDLETCPYCPRSFFRAASLQLHFEACHASQNETCSHEDCQDSPGVFTLWALKLHRFEAHEAMAMANRCPFPECQFSSRTKGRQARRRVLMVHLNVRHALVTGSFAALQSLDLKEVMGRTTMIDPNFTYIDISTSADIPTSTLPLPGALIEDCQQVGARRKPSYRSSEIYEQLRIQAIFKDEEVIYDHNLFKLASIGYDGILLYRQGIRCVGAWDTLSCVSNKTINMRNTIVSFTVKRNANGIFQKTLILGTVYETCRGIRQLISSMFCSGRWRAPTAEQDACDTLNCGNQLAMGTHLCLSHALNAVDRSVTRSPVRIAVEHNQNRRMNCDISTPNEAARWFADERNIIQGITHEEIEFYERLRDRRDAFATDVETVGPLLIQMAIIDADRNVVIGGYIHHSCATVKELWDLATKTCGGTLTSREMAALRKAFGSPSMKKPRGDSMHWLVDQLKALKMKYPDMLMAEWATHPFDQIVYRDNIKRAGYNHEDILPAPGNWVSPMRWLQVTGPMLPGYQLAYVACLYYPSDLVFRWHDAIVDAVMLMDILSTRQQKYHHGKVEDASGDGDILIRRPWTAREEKLCLLFLQDKLEEYKFATQMALYRAVSYHLFQHGFFRTSLAVAERVTRKARREESEGEYGTCPDKQAHDLLMSINNTLSAPRSTLWRVALLEPNANPAATLIVQQAYETIPINAQYGGWFWSRCRNRAHALNKTAGSACTEQELDLALLTMVNERRDIRCGNCGAATRDRKCKLCKAQRGIVARLHVDGLVQLACIEEGCNEDRLGGLRRCVNCFKERMKSFRRSNNKDLISLGTADEERVDSGDELAKSSNAVANKRKRDQDDEDDNHLKPYKRQQYSDTDEGEQSDCDCGKLKQGKSTRCADCAREWRKKRIREWNQKKRDEARMAKTCEEEDCPRPPEGLSTRCAECRQRRKEENKKARSKRKTVEARESRETGVPLGECRKCKVPSYSEKGLCPTCLRAYKAQRRREKKREDGIETDCIEDGCDREIVPGQARCAVCLERVKPICESCNGEGRRGLKRCAPCQRVVDKEQQKIRDQRRALKKQQLAAQSADVEDGDEE